MPKLYVNRDPRFTNPYGECVDSFAKWIVKQPYVVRLLKRLVDDGYTIDAMGPNAGHIEVYRHLLDTPISPEPVFVFGSNEAGRHGTGAALYARNFRGAKQGVGEGPTGQTYAIPTKDRQLQVLPLDTIAANIQTFFNHAHHTPDVNYLFSRVGCGRAGYKDSHIQPIVLAELTRYPTMTNVSIPIAWKKDHNPAIIVAGSRHLAGDELVYSVTKTLSRFPTATVISGAARGMDVVGEIAAVRLGLPLLRFPAYWEYYDKSAGYIRNELMAHHATMAVIIWDGQSHGTKSMINIVNDRELDLILQMR